MTEGRTDTETPQVKNNNNKLRNRFKSIKIIYKGYTKLEKNFVIRKKRKTKKNYPNSFFFFCNVYPASIKINYK